MLLAFNLLLSLTSLRLSNRYGVHTHSPLNDTGGLPFYRLHFTDLCILSHRFLLILYIMLLLPSLMTKKRVYGYQNRDYCFSKSGHYHEVKMEI
jgi:hypothetical protein